MGVGGGIFLLTKEGLPVVFHFISQNQSNKSNRVSRKKEKKVIQNQLDNNPKQLDNNYKQPLKVLHVQQRLESDPYTKCVKSLCVPVHA
jgi:hypothetical protein